MLNVEICWINTLKHYTEKKTGKCEKSGSYNWLRNVMKPGGALRSWQDCIEPFLRSGGYKGNHFYIHQNQLTVKQ